MSMIFLYNKERILLEGLELAKLKISEKLGLAVNIVEAEYVLEEGKLVPNFNIDKEKIPMGKVDEVSKIIESCWLKVLELVYHRLEALSNEGKVELTDPRIEALKND